jgi:aryl-alcohol dehydrogenase-like predicted oxidoreductase
MRYLVLGRTGLRVSQLSLGTMTFGGTGMWEAVGALDQKRAEVLVAKALEAGINLFDTADFYAAGESETMLGKALGARRKDNLIATKVRLKMGEGPNAVGLSRAHVLDAADASLKRLGTDYIDLYQIHAPDPLTPIDETLRALEDLVRWGKVRYLGASNLAAWQMMKALWSSDRGGFARFEALQAYYNLAARELERELVPMLQDQQLGLLVWSPLAGGFLSGKVAKDGSAPKDSRLAGDRFLPLDIERGQRIVDVLREVGSRHSVSPARVALAWLLAQPVVTSVILGARRPEQLEDNIASTRVKLRSDELERLAAVSALAEEYPGWMLRRSAADRALS